MVSIYRCIFDNCMDASADVDDNKVREILIQLNIAHPISNK